jgi:hypothetical protein
MKRTSWEWQNSNKKRAIQIMWDTQGQDFDYVVDLICEACNLDNAAARALYRKVSRDELIEQGFVPAPAKLGRPRKDGTAPAPVRATARPVEVVATPVVVEPEPEPERTETGEKKSIVDMKAYLEQLKRKAG